MTDKLLEEYEFNTDNYIEVSGVQLVKVEELNKLKSDKQKLVDMVKEWVQTMESPADPEIDADLFVLMIEQSQQLLKEIEGEE